MIQKYAEFKVIEAKRGGRLRPASQRGRRRTAHKATFDYEPREGYIYVRSRAISSRCNDNFDEFPAEEIKKAYKTFVGKPVFVNHHNEDHRKARGFIIDAVLHEDVNPDGSEDTWAEVLMEVDAVRYPKLAEAILKGHIDRTSMGTDVAYSVCSICGNKASTPLDYCFPPGELVTMADGTLKPIEQVQQGERVLTHDGSGIVSATMVREYHGPLAVIFRKGYAAPLRVTHGHEVLANLVGRRDESRSGAERYASVHLAENWQWTPSERLDEGNWLQGAYPTETQPFTHHLAEMALDLVEEGDRVRLPGAKFSMPASVSDEDEGLAFIVGLYLAEGSLETARTRAGTPKCISWTLGSHEESLVHRLQVALDKFGAGTLRQYRSEGTLTVRLSNAPLAALLDHLCGTGSRDKALHGSLMLAPQGFQRVMLDAYHLGDGWEDPRGHVEVRSASSLLSRQMVMLGARVDEAIPSWWTNRNNRGGPTRREARFEIHHVGMGHHGAMKGRRRLAPGYYAAQVVDSQVEDYCGPVYNIEVEEQHSYVAEGVVTHNCRHIPAMKGQTIHRTTASGEKVPVLVRELCYGLGFFENSLLVEDPADPTAFVVDVDDRGVGGGYEGDLKTAARRSHTPRGKQPRPPYERAEPANYNQRVASRRQASPTGFEYPGYFSGETDPGRDRHADPSLHLVRDRDPSTAPGGAFDTGYADALNGVPRRQIANQDYYDGYAYGLEVSQMGHAAARRRHGYGEVSAPQEVDTLRDEACPVCGDEGYDGEECKNCAYQAPPEQFDDPDLSKHRKVDLQEGYVPEQDQEPDPRDIAGDPALGDSTPAFADEEAGAAVPDPGENGEPVPSDPTEEQDAEPLEDDDEALAADLESTLAEDEALLSEVTEVLDQVKHLLGPDEESPRVQDQVRDILDEVEDMLGGGAVPTDSEEPEDDEEGDEDEDDDLPDFLTSDDDDDDDDDEDDDEDKKAAARTRGPVRAPRTPTEGVTASSSHKERRDMGPALKALKEVSASLRAVASNQRRLQQQIDLISRAAGLEKHTASLRIHADEENPAQPVPTPESKPPEEDTTETARGNPEGSGELQDPGGTSETETAADTKGDLFEPGASLDNESLEAPDDVTKPVEGTEERRPLDEVRTEVEPVARGLDTEPAYPESADIFDGPAKLTSKQPSEARFMVAMRLARARIASGIATDEDDLTLATKIAQDKSLSDDAIRQEVETLGRVREASKRRSQQAAPQSGGRRLVPREAQRSVPSLSAQASPNGSGGTDTLTPEMPLGVQSDEFLWE